MGGYPGLCGCTHVITGSIHKWKKKAGETVSECCDVRETGLAIAGFEYRRENKQRNVEPGKLGKFPPKTFRMECSLADIFILDE